MNPKVDFYFTKPTPWQQEYKTLRSLILDCGLTEELRWGCPCYSYNGQNIVLIHGFKNYCALLFMKGVLLQDAAGILIQQTKNVQAARQIRFTGLQEIVKMKTTLKAYIFEAIEVEKAGLKVELKKTAEFTMPAEFKNKLAKDATLKAAFKALTPGRQRGYLLYFSSAKQAKTREARIEKYIPYILKGKGVDDDYTSTKK
ncbi:MAG TPA: YdeI/OmpD-associated family protein [Bacteroidia bacterium]|nr:YdeI/OmpD-associated family protein [Bacteroidia bacterium]